ncbi:signal peptidase I, partial [Actinomyces sp. AC-18-1]
TRTDSRGRRRTVPPVRTPRAPAERRRRRRPRLSVLVAVLVVLVVTALVKTLVIQWFEIPSASMEDTLAVGDRVAVWMSGADDLERGDVVVFRDPDHWLDAQEPTGLRGAVQDLLILMRQLPEDTGHILIKRVIGLPGDRVVADGSGTVSVNGVVLDEGYVKEGRSGSDVAFDVVVPEGFIWVMGDNRSNSADSRYHQDDAHGGFVPMSDVIGEGAAVVWPVSSWAGLGDGTRAFDGVPEPGQAPAPAQPAPEEGA